MRRDYVNPKKSIRKHLQKRNSNFASLYIVFVLAILAVGIIGMLLRSDWQSEASGLDSEMNSEFMGEELLAENQENLAPTLNLPETIEVEAADTLFPRTTKESLLREMVEKEAIELTELEEQYFETH